MQLAGALRDARFQFGIQTADLILRVFDQTLRQPLLRDVDDGGDEAGYPIVRSVHRCAVDHRAAARGDNQRCHVHDQRAVRGAALEPVLRRVVRDQSMASYRWRRQGEGRRTGAERLSERRAAVNRERSVSGGG